MTAAPAASTVPRFKVLLVGDASVGKSTFLSRHIYADAPFAYDLIPSTSVNVQVVTHATPEGPVEFECWDIPGALYPQQQHYIGASAAILMFDVTVRKTYKAVPQWYKDLVMVCGNIPIVLCGSKIDHHARSVQPRDIQFHRKKNLQYYDLSSKSLHNFNKPFDNLVCKLRPPVFAEDTLWLPPMDQCVSDCLCGQGAAVKTLQQQVAQLQTQVLDLQQKLSP